MNVVFNFVSKSARSIILFHGCVKCGLFWAHTNEYKIC